VEGEPPEGLRLPRAGRLRLNGRAPRVGRRPCSAHARARREERLDRAQRLEERAALERALAAWNCPGCRAGDPEVCSTTGRTRYVRCRSCGATGKIILSGEEDGA